MGEKLYGVVTREVLLAHDGLDFLQSIIDGRLPHPPMSETLGFHLTDVSSGRAVFEGEPALHHYNPFGSVHGGFAATLLDSALGCAILSTLVKGEFCTTLELKLNYTRTVLADSGPLRAEGRVLHRGRNVAIADGDLKDGAGKLYAHATTTYMILTGKN